MFDEQFIIKQFLENQKLALPSALNASNLTLVLRTIGFFLHEFDIAPSGGDPEDTNLSIEIKCSKSGLISKLYLPYHDCHCQGDKPPENKAFWEVHGNQPNSPSCSLATTPRGTTIVHETATNLLPEVDHTWKILAKNMFNFMVRMQNGIAKYKDEQNNMEYGDITITTKEVEGHTETEPPVEVDNKLITAITGENNEPVLPINKDVSPVFVAVKQRDTPYSTPLSSINVTPVVPSNATSVGSGAPKDEGPISLTENTTGSYNEESIVIALVMEAKAKLDHALLRLKFNSADENIFHQNFPLETLSVPGSAALAPPNPNRAMTKEKTMSVAILRRRSTNSNIEAVTTAKITTEPTTSKIPPRVVGRQSTGSAELRKSVGGDQKRLKVSLPTQTRTTALRNQKAKN